jgi:hypothetical protein
VIPRAAVLFVLGFAACVSGQTALPAIKAERIFVGSFGENDQAAQIRRAVMDELRRHGRLKVVESPQAADGILTGKGEVWIKGYYSLNPRARSLSEDAHPIFGGYLSVELRGQGNTVLWSYLATPHRSGSDAISRNLAAQVVKKLREALDH